MAVADQKIYLASKSPRRRELLRQIGIEFEKSRDVFRLRMIEQICHIEHYRKEILLQEGVLS